MLNRGRELATKEGMINYMSFTQVDLNKWKSGKVYTSVIANQSLHHIQSLEDVFGEIKKSLHEHGAFISSDMIGRNGHQRWPEALLALHEFWKKLPESHKYNHQLKRHEEMYENWDCSTEGFEGIRAQDILPLLIKNFDFHLFIAFSNVIDVFVDRNFGPNFNPTNKWDTDFIDAVHQFDEESIRNGLIKPTHMRAVMRKYPADNLDYSRCYSPEYCVRNPSASIDRIEVLRIVLAERDREFAKELAMRDKEIADLKDALMATLDQKAKEQDLIFASHSWRITAPLRRIAGSLRECMNRLPRSY